MSARGSTAAAGRASVDLVVALRNARDLIDRRFAEPLDLDAMADAAGYARHYFAHRFREVFGQTPRRYLTGRRIERACDLLRNANLTVTEICMLVGFSSVGSFSSRFSTVMGCSPVEYRKRSHVAGAAAIPGCFVLAWAGRTTANTASPEKPPAASRA